LKIVIDMNLGVDWVICLQHAGHEAAHWSSIGRLDDDDAAIMNWAASNDHAVLTADLDFGTLLAASRIPWPSVIQLRTPKTLASYAGSIVIEALRQCGRDIEVGALITIYADRFRVRPLPI
jgi:predicted nuclease of predicted toxin-antitoxin system